ncbi:MAG: hypothetical protein AAFU03_04080, partial [Bacteroidota bacterium]
NAYLRNELDVWAKEFVQNRVSSLRSRKISSSRQLERSLAYEVRGQAVDAAVQAIIGFEEHGRFIDMRRLQPPEGGADYIANLIQWLERKGLAEKFTRGYVRRRNLKRPPDRVLTYIAFAMARKRFRGKFRRRRWYNRSKTAAVNELYNDIQANMPERIAQLIRESFVQQ